MNSWAIIKNALSVGTKPNTMGRLIEINKSIDLFFSLRTLVKDEVEAVKSLNEDKEVTEALLARGQIKLLKEYEVLR